MRRCMRRLSHAEDSGFGGRNCKTDLILAEREEGWNGCASRQEAFIQHSGSRPGIAKSYNSNPTFGLHIFEESTNVQMQQLKLNNINDNAELKHPLFQDFELYAAIH